MNKSRLLGAVYAAVFSFITLPSHAALVGVLPTTPGSTDWQAYYDEDANLTWLANANATVGSVYDTYDPGSGLIVWADANAWAAGLDINGVTGWRLPDTSPIDGTTVDDATLSYIGTEDRGFNVSAPGTLYAGSQASEMAYLFYNTLGNKSYYDPALSTVSTGNGPQAGYGLTNTGPFSNIQPGAYWSSTVYAPNTDNAWLFNFFSSGQYGSNKSNIIDAWAVRSGGSELVSSVPIPAAL